MYTEYTCKYKRFIQKNYLDKHRLLTLFHILVLSCFLWLCLSWQSRRSLHSFQVRCRYRNILVLIGTVYAFHVTVWPLYRSWVSSFFCCMESFLKISLLFHFLIHIWFTFFLKIELIFKAWRTTQNSFLLSIVLNWKTNNKLVIKLTCTLSLVINMLQFYQIILDKAWV